MPASAFEWYVMFHHDAHTHPGPTAADGVTNGTFSIPNSGETSASVFYRLYLVVTDAQGGKDTSFTDILPRTSTITLNTNPQGLQVTLDGQPFAAPLTVTSVEGILRTIGAPSPQGIYTFSNWSHGGNATQTFATPTNDVTYTANFNAAMIVNAVADAYVNAGKNANTNFGAATTLFNQANASANKSYETFLRFDISAISANISSAILRLNGRLNNLQTPAITVEAHDVTNTSWLENTITWNNKPAAQAAILATAIVNNTSNQYYEWNITQHIVNLRNAGINAVTIKLVNTNSSNNQIIFNSKEAAGNRPQLVVSDAGARQSFITQIESEVFETGANIYPNPAKGVLNIVNTEPGVIKLYDVSGRLVKQQKVMERTFQQINISELRNGLYLLRIENAKGILSKKIVIQN